MRTVNDFNREYERSLVLAQICGEERSEKGKLIKNAVFYLLLTLVVLFTFFYASNAGGGIRFGPFSYSVVLSESMQSVYPKGSLITTYAIEPDTLLEAGLENGSDIVFMTEDGTRIVHRIIEIYNNYEDSGQRAFRTQGVNNQSPDAGVVFEGNVVGRVTWHIPFVGAALGIISDNIIWFIVAVVGVAAFVTSLMIVFRKEANPA